MNNLLKIVISLSFAGGIGRLCEFACDESVIKYLDKDGRQKYGDTLINSLGIGGAYLHTDQNAGGTNTEKLEAYAEEEQISSGVQGQLQEFPQSVCVGAHVSRIRAGAGEEFDVVGLLAEGEKLIILEAAEGKDEQTWYRIDKESLTEDMDVSSVEDCYILLYNRNNENENDLKKYERGRFGLKYEYTRNV